jgi:endo-1,4-beta-xylanase
VKQLPRPYAFVLALLVVALLAGALSIRAATAQSGLRGVAGDFLIGYASTNDFWNLPDAAKYQEVAAREFNILTPENQMKFDAIHPERNTYNFEPADRHVAFAQQNGMQVHGHTLLWYQQLPGWLTNTNWSKDELIAVMNNHIDTVVGHYKGKVAIWDVVNEAFSDNNDGQLRNNSIWNTVIGPQHIELAFQRARAADPSAKLLYNDYATEEINAKSDGVYKLVADFKQRGIPIDGVGFQMHITGDGLNYDSVARNFQRFADLGVEVYITEMDVRISAQPSDAELTKQAEVYRNITQLCRAQAACKGLQLWGFTDKYSWVPAFFQGMGSALIFDNNYQPKPAYTAMQSA